MERWDMRLKPRVSGGGRVTQDAEGTWRLEIPGGAKGRYRLAQMDDYTGLNRQGFRWQPPFQMRLQARLSAGEIPGTWGFGVWNDPFSASLGLGGADRRLPALPQAAWFFFASPHNYLSFRDDLPARGFLAATFRSARLPPGMLATGSPLLAGLLLPPLSRLMRRIARRLIQQEARLVAVDPTLWHTYSLDWQEERVRLEVDEAVVLETETAPQGRLGLVLWVDNQFAAWNPGGQVRLGSLENPEPVWLKLKFLPTLS